VATGDAEGRDDQVDGLAHGNAKRTQAALSYRSRKASFSFLIAFRESVQLPSP
jgi:hypothetical protein